MAELKKKHPVTKPNIAWLRRDANPNVQSP